MTLRDISTPFEKTKRIEQAISELRKRYKLLVWYGSTNPERLEAQGCTDLIGLWEILDMENNRNGEWDQGFNCGMMACTEYFNVFIRDYVSGCTDGISDGRAMAEDIFPDLLVANGYAREVMNKIGMAVGEHGKLRVRRE